MRDIGKNIKTLRERQGLTQEALSEKLFVTRQTLSNYENGRTRPDIEMLKKIAEELGQDITVLIYGPPSTEEQRRAHRRLLTGGVLTALALVPVLLAHHFDRAWATYDLGAKVLGGLVCQPLFWLLLGWTLLQGILPATRSKPLSGKWVPAIRWGLLGLLILYTLLAAPQLAAFALHTEVSLSLGLTLDRLLMRLTLFLMRFPAVFLLLGAGLRLCEFPSSGKASE